jgi:hypothetical protein
VATASVTVLHLAIGGWLVWMSRDHLNPDGVAYIELARHYVDGRIDLAVSSYWSPLLSWLLVPVAGFEPLLAARILLLLSSVAFALGVRQLTREWIGATSDIPPAAWTGPEQVAYAAALALSLTMLPRPVSPDLLLAAAVTWYLVWARRLLASGGGREGRTVAVGAGLAGGLAYLAKAYALPFVLAHIPLTAIARTIVGRAPWPAIVRDAALSLAAFGIAAGPWIIAVSLSEGRPTFSGVGRFARPWNAPPVLHPEPEAFFKLALPPPGRLAVWENPSELPDDWVWHEGGESRSVANFMQTIWLNTGRVVRAVREADPFGLIAIGLIGSAALAIWSTCFGSRPMVGPIHQVWALATMALYASGYAALYVEARYLWPAFGLALALVVTTGAGTVGRFGHAASDRSGLPRAGGAIAAIALLASLALGVWREMDQWRGPGSIGADATRIRAFGQGLRGSARLASNDWPHGLFTSYWSRAPYLGQYRGADADTIARELAPFSGRDAGTTVVIFDDPALARRLRADPRFAPVEIPGADDWFPAAFRIQ